MTKERRTAFSVRVPASTANLGAGFDCFGLALELYLSVRATILSAPGAKTVARSRGASGSTTLPSNPEENLILRAMRFTGEREGFSLPAVRLAVQNAIPVASGLGSSAAAAVAGIALAFRTAGRELHRETALQYAREIDGHADNVAAAIHGGLVVTLARGDSVVAVKKRWPKAIRLVVVIPELTLETKKSRSVLPEKVDLGHAVYNLQRSALLVALLEEKRYELLWDALEDRLHQPFRQNLIPGVPEILALPQSPGLLGIALSGSGPSVVALAIAQFDEIGRTMSGCFQRAGVASTVRILEADQDGLMFMEPRPSRN
jgi:homoserine kinase